MRLSKYNYEVTNESNNKFLVYNLLFDSLCIFETPLREFVKKATPNELKVLESQGFIYLQNEIKEPRCISDIKRIDNSKKLKHVTITPTLACNARCTYCYEENVVHKSVDDNEISQFVNFLNRYLDKNTLVHFTLFGGEPILKINSVAKMLTSIDSDINYYTTAITNGSLISKDVIETFKLINLKKLQISIDGFSKEYDVRKSYVDNTTFDKVISNIEMCLRNDISVSLRLNIDKDNIDNMLMLIEYLSNKFSNDRLTAYPAFLFGEKVKHPLIDEKDCQDAVNAIMDKLIETNIVDPKVLLKKKIIGSPCMAHRNDSIVIDPYGHLFKCEHDVGNKHLSVGDILDGLTEQRNAKAIPLKNSFLECTNCIFLPKCCGGCDASRRDCNNPCGMIKYLVPYFLNRIVNNTLDIQSCFI